MDSIRSILAQIFRLIASRVGYEMVPEHTVFDFQIQSSLQPVERGSSVPENARVELRPDHPDLIDLRNRYADYDDQVTTPLLWTPDRLSNQDLSTFRGHNAFLYQVGSQNRNILGYLLQAYYLQNHDILELWDRLQEKGDFGVRLFDISGKRVSRDLLDSIMEINFLEKTLNLSSEERFSVLDIGAGYGRLAHRMVSGMPNLDIYLCTDAIPESTFICDYYLQHRGIQDKATSVPLDRIESRLNEHDIGLAVNIHSFSECTLDAIEWWITLLKDNRIPFLFIVPNSGRDLLTNEGQDFQPLLNSKGYQEMVVEPKYKDPTLHRYAANPGYYHLYKLNT